MTINGNVIHVLTGLEGYGVAAVVRQLASGLPSARFVCLGPGQMQMELARERVLYVGSHNCDVSVGKSTALGVIKYMAAAVRWLLTANAVSRKLPSGKCLLHAHSTVVVIVCILIKIWRISDQTHLVYHFHSTMNKERLWGVLPYLQRKLIGSCVDAIVSVSENSARFWQPASCRLFVIHNGVSSVKCVVPRSLACAGKINFISAASLSEEKGQRLAMEAFHHVVPRHPEAHLWIAGDSNGPYAAYLRGYAKTLGISENITFLGRVSDVRAIAANMQVALQLRITAEPCSVWVIEAMSAGLPIIATATGGTPELVRDGVEGTLVCPGDPTLLFEAMIRMCEDAKFRDACARNSAARALNFTEERFMREMLGVYSEVLNPS